MFKPPVLECILVLQVIWYSEAFDITGEADKLRNMPVKKREWFQYRGTDNDKQILWLSWLPSFKLMIAFES